MKKSKLIILIVSVFLAVSIIVGSVAFVYSRLEENDVFDGKLVKVSSDSELVYGDKTFKKGETVKVTDPQLQDCVLLLDKSSGVMEVFTSKYAPLFEKEKKTNYYLRHRGGIIVKKDTVSKSQYVYSAYSDKQYSLPELNINNIKKIKVCFGDYYDQKKNVIDGFASGVAYSVEGDSSVFNIRKYYEFSEETEYRSFLSELERTGGLESLYKYWCEQSGRDNIFFEVIFVDDEIPCSLLFTKDAIKAD